MAVCEGFFERYGTGGAGVWESDRQSKDVETREQGQAQLWGQGVISFLKRGHAGDDGVDVQL